MKDVASVGWNDDANRTDGQLVAVASERDNIRRRLSRSY